MLRFLGLPELLPPELREDERPFLRSDVGGGARAPAGALRGTEPGPVGTPGAHGSTGERDGADVRSSDPTRDASPGSADRGREHFPTSRPWPVVACSTWSGWSRTPCSTSRSSSVVTRGLGVTATGMFFEAVALFNILATASQWGADVGVVRAIPRYRVQGRSEDLRHGIRAALAPTVLAGAVLGGGDVRPGRSVGAFAHERRASRRPDGRAPRDGSVPYRERARLCRGARGDTRVRRHRYRASSSISSAAPRRQPIFVLAVVITGLSGAALSLAWALPFALGVDGGPHLDGPSCCVLTRGEADPDPRSERLVAAEPSSSSSGCSPVLAAWPACSRSSSCGSTPC